MKLKKLTGYIIAAALLIGLLPALPASAASGLSINDDSVMGADITPGASSTITFTIQNDTGVDLEYVELWAAVTNATAEIAKITTPFIGIDETYGVTLPVTTRAGATAGTYFITLETSSKVQGEDRTIPGMLSLRVNVLPGQTSGAMLDIQFSDTSVETNGKGTLNVTIQNKGTVAATNVRFTLDGFTGGLVLTSNGTKTFASIGPGSQYVMYFTYTADSTMNSGYYPITGMLSYHEYENGLSSIPFPFGISVTKPYTDTTTGVIIENIMLTKQSVAINEPFTMQVVVYNAGRSAIRNVRLTVTHPESIYNTSANTITLNSIAGSSRQTFSFQFIVGEGTTPKFHAFEATLTFDELLGNGYTEGTVKQSTGVYVKPDDGGSGAPPANVTIDSARLSKPSVAPGDDVTMDVVVTNNGTSTVYNLMTTFTPDTALINRTQNIIMSGTLEAGQSRTVSCTFFPKPGTAAGNYTISVAVTFQTKNGDSESAVTLTQYAGVFVEGAGGSASNVVIENATMSPGTVKPGADAVMTVVVTNKGATPVYNLKTTFTPAEGLINRTQNIIMSGTLRAGESRTLSCTVFSKLDIAASSYMVSVGVSYQTIEGSTESEVALTQYAGLYVQGKLTDGSDDPGGTSTVPKIIVQSYTVTPQIVAAGQEFDLVFVFENTSSEKSVSNIKVSFSAVESTTTNNNVFTPVGASNTFYIDSIPTKGTVERSVRLYTVPDAKQKTYTLTLHFEYEDANATPYTQDEQVGIPVVQEAKLGTGDLNFMPDTMVGQQAYLSIDFYNAGKEIMYNFTVSTEGDFDSTNKSYYVGQFEPGATDFYDNNITPWMAGEVEGKLIFSFEDAAGVLHTEERLFTLNVMESYEPGPDDWTDMFPPEPEEDGGFLHGIMSTLGAWFWVIIGAVAAGMAALVTLLVLRRKKRKARIMDDEDFIDELDMANGNGAAPQPPYANVLPQQDAPQDTQPPDGQSGR